MSQPFERLPLNRDGETLGEILGVKSEEFPSSEKEMDELLEVLLSDRDPRALRKITFMLAIATHDASKKSPFFSFFMFFVSRLAPGKGFSLLDFIDHLEQAIMAAIEDAEPEVVKLTLKLALAEITIISSEEGFVLKYVPLMSLFEKMGATTMSTINQKPI